MLRGLPNDVYFTVGLITIIGLAAKDAILIIELAKDLHLQRQVAGRSHHRSLYAALPPDRNDGPCLRLRRAADGGRPWRRPSQQALSTGVMGGMIAVVILALLIAPAFFVSVLRFFSHKPEKVKQEEVFGPPTPAKS